MIEGIVPFIMSFFLLFNFYFLLLSQLHFL
jgi:hypothetical protein